MSAETLRRAAALMRERTRRASPPPHDPWTVLASAGEWSHVVDCMGIEVASTGTPTTAEHIASWHPAVALTVADWLDACAERLLPGVFAEDDLIFAPALAVARTYLSEEA